jgi:hypothetical protein
MANNRPLKLSTLIEAFPEYPNFESHGTITDRAAHLYRERNLVKPNAKTPNRTAAEEIQELNRDTDTYATFIRKGGSPTARPNLFERVQGKGWALRADKDSTYLAAGVRQYQDMIGFEIFVDAANQRPFRKRTGSRLGEADGEVTEGPDVTSAWEIPSEFNRISKKRSDWEKLKQEAAETGAKGEEFVNHYFQQKIAHHEICQFEWISKIYENAPADFRITLSGHEKEWAEVKSTHGPFQRPFFMSWYELLEAAKDRKYAIYRIYEISEDTAKLRILPNFNVIAKRTIAVLKRLPSKITLDSLIINPGTSDKETSPEITLRLG